ncbi:flagellar export protein FliJ [Inconstantimicrobium mannanitabidum]|uniref:Flagellar protein FliJ n=1 Tax=Inconstantimicrobium mannanitabidum TaxID=1604901 RepID=A0ACB5R8H3_9CLOT|nr:flagellar export protein FliJ [Clostridium sp. TW13]GKX65490.1 flagellar protein FliJ [Clostridium sp. TW13]
MEKAFKFKLEKVLEIRQEKENESVRLFKKIQEEKLKVENEINDLNEKYEKNKILKKNENAAYQKIKRNYINALNRGIKQKEKELAVKESELEIRRNDLKIKQMERKTVEIIKDKRYAQFVAEENRKEQVTIDELALYAFLRKEQ